MTGALEDGCGRQGVEIIEVGHFLPYLTIAGLTPGFTFPLKGLHGGAVHTHVPRDTHGRLWEAQASLHPSRTDE